MPPKVLVGTPTSEAKVYCLGDYLAGLGSISYPNFEVHLTDNSKTSAYFRALQQSAKTWNQKHTAKMTVGRQGYTSPKVRARICNARNELRQKALAGNYDYLFCLDQDVLAKPELVRLLVEDRQDLVAAVCFTEMPKADALLPNCLQWADEKREKVRLVAPNELSPPGLHKMAVAGFGAALFSRKLLKEIAFGYDPATEAGEDAVFCRDAEKEGFGIFVDSRLVLEHKPSAQKYAKAEW